MTPRLPAATASTRAIRFLALSAAAVVALAFPIIWTDRLSDVDVFWEAGLRIRAGGAALYDVPEISFGTYLYPPTFAALFAPLTFLPRWLAFSLWSGLQLGGIAAVFWALRGLFGVPAWRSATFYGFLIAAGWGALVWNYRQGQINTLVLALVLGGLLLIERRRPGWGGGLIGLAAMLKIIPIVLLGVLAVQRRWRAVGGVLLGVAIGWMAPLVWTVPDRGMVEGFAGNVEMTEEYVGEVAGPRLEAQVAVDAGGVRAPNNSLSAVTHRLFATDHLLTHKGQDRSPLVTDLPSGLVRWTGFALGVVLYGLALTVAHRRAANRTGLIAATGLALVAAGLGNLLYWPHHLVDLLVLVAPLAALALAATGGSRRIVAVALISTLAVYLPVFINRLVTTPTALDGLAVWGVPTFGVLAVWGIAFRTFWERKPAADQVPESRELVAAIRG